ncbi:MAG: TlpA disulfide reductase family protein [candidate division WOR-3 bacterium]
MTGLLMSLIIGSTSAPDFTLKDTDGLSVKLSDLASGGPVLLVFWTACCNRGPDALSFATEIYKEKKDKGLSVLAVNLDGTGRHGFIRELVATYKWPFPVLLDPSRDVAAQYRVLAVPSFIIVNKDMEIAYYGLGFSDDQKKKVRAEIEKLLK